MVPRLIRVWFTLVTAASQIEFSANCNNPDFPLCAPPPAGVGLSGIWLWIEIDAAGSGDVAGAGCGHVRGVGGGAESIRGDITWVKITIPPGAFPYWTDPTNTYYLVTLPGGASIPFPVTQGHYSFVPAPAVDLRLQVPPQTNFPPRAKGPPVVPGGPTPNQRCGASEPCRS